MISQSDSERFKRLIFRVSKGNAWSYLVNADPEEVFQIGTENQKICVFMIVFSGGQQDILRSRVNKVCESFNARRYDTPKDTLTF